MSVRGCETGSLRYLESGKAGDRDKEVGDEERSESAGVEGYEESSVTVAVSSDVWRVCVFAKVLDPAVEGRE